jgi:hypothetical protein
MSPRTAAGASKNLGEMEGLHVSKLIDLLAATEAVGNYDRSWPGGLNGREQFLLGDDTRDLEFIAFEAEWTSHAATPCLDVFNRCAGLAEDCDFAHRTAENCFVMTVTMNENLSALEAARAEAGSLGG